MALYGERSTLDGAHLSIANRIASRWRGQCFSGAWPSVLGDMGDKQAKRKERGNEVPRSRGEPSTVRFLEGAMGERKDRQVAGALK